MGILIGVKLPKIELMVSYPKVVYTLLFNYKHFGPAGTLYVDWPEEFALKDVHAANTNRTLLERFNGYRFTIALGITDAYLKTGAGNDYESERFEDNLNYLSIWSRKTGNIIRVYPWQDKTFWYDCVIAPGGYQKTPHSFGEDGFKTKASDYVISLIAKTLTQEKPNPTSRPWDPSTP